MDALPKYIQNANRVIEVIAAEPNHTWTKTQRELGERIGLNQPDLSNIVKLLRDTGKVQHGHPLPGRGRMHALVLVDDTPYASVPMRNTLESEQHVLTPEEAIEGAWDLGELSVEQVGLAVVRMIRQATSADERHVKTRSELNERLSRYRDQLSEERQLRINMAQNLQKLEREKGELEEQVARLRTELNGALMRAQDRKKGAAAGTPIANLLDDDSLKALRRLAV